MQEFLKRFKPDPHLPEIEDEGKVKNLYHYWRIRTLYSILFGYAFYYFTRKSLVYAAPMIISDLGFSKSELGIFGTILSISYGFSKFISGIISDQSNPRYFMAIGLIMTGVSNIFFGMSSSLVMFSVFWALNGWFQGFGWPPCARLLTHWYSHSERGSWWSTWNMGHNLGSFIIPWIVTYALTLWGWRSGMFIPGIIAILGGLFILNRLRDTPQSLGLPSIEKYRNDFPSNKNLIENEKELTTKEILFDYVLKNRYIWLLGFAYFFIYTVRMGINDWTGIYLMETKDYSLLAANGTVSLFEIGGFIGSLVAGWSSDYIFGARRGPVNALFAVGICFSVLGFWLIPKGNSLLDSLMLFILGFSIFGPQMLIGITAAELSHKKAAATSTGFVGWMAYLGAAVAGYPLGLIAQEIGWNGFFWFLTGCSLLAVLLLFPLWTVTEGPVISTKIDDNDTDIEPNFA